MLILKHVLILALCMAGAACVQAQEGKPFVFSGEIRGMKSETVYLDCKDADPAIADSMQMTNGHFRFKGTLREPLFFVFKVGGTSPRQLGIFLEPGSQTLTADKDSMGRYVLQGAAPATTNGRNGPLPGTRLPSRRVHITGGLIRLLITAK